MNNALNPQSLILHLFILLLFSIGVLCLSSCDRDNPEPGVPDLTIQFPMKVGNSWRYHTLLEQRDTFGTIIYKDELESTWEVQKDTIITGKPAYKIKFLDSSYKYGIQVCYGYFTHTASGLYLIAAIGNPGVTLKTTAFQIPFSAFAPLGLGKTDHFYMPKIPVCPLKYPMKLNDIWEYSGYADSSFSRRTYLAKEKITVPAGTFNCVKVKAIYSSTLHEPPVHFFYFGEKGLTRETYFYDLTDIDKNVSVLTISTHLLSTNF